MSTTAPLPPLTLRATLRFDVVSGLIDRLDPSSVLEIGCGQGAVGARLARRADYLGVEPDEASSAVAIERVAASGGTVLHADHRGVPAGRTFDLVCAFEVLEHIEDDHAALAEWVGLVRPGGHVMLSVPAYQERFGPSDVRVGHFRRYSPEQLTEVLRGSGLVEPDVRLYGWPLGYALEAVGHRIDARHLSEGTAEATVEERTARSGRHRQPARAAIGRAIQGATWPFRRMQRLTPGRGIGVVAVARRPG